MLKNKRILVTGGAGFVGSNLTRRLLALGASVIVLDDLFSGKKDAVPTHKNLTFQKGSVTNMKLVRKLVRDVRIVFHLAARNIVVSTRDPLNDYHVNIGGTLKVLLAVKEAGKKIERLVYASSASVYGNPRHLPLDEDDRSNVLSPYAASKLGGENYCMAFCENYGVPSTIVRYSNIYGEGQDPLSPYCGVVSKFMKWALNKKPLLIHDDGCQTRDFTYIDDAVHATVLAGTNPQACGNILNVGTGMETAVNTLAQIILKIAGADLPVRYIDRRDIDNVRRRAMNIEKIRKQLGWLPEIQLEEGLRRTFAWAKETFACQR